MVGIIGAMNVEIEALCDMLTDKQVDVISLIKYIKGKLMGVDCVLASCGPGKVNAAVCTQTMILMYSTSIIINTGVAGGIGDNVKIGDIVVASSVVQHDMDTSSIGDPKGFISGINMIEIPCSKFLCEKIGNVISEFKDIKFHNGVIATGDQFISDLNKLNKIKKDFNALACEMEGGSIGHVCYMNNVDFIVLRAISDNGNDNAAFDYNKFLSYAANIYVDLMSNVIATLE